LQMGWGYLASEFLKIPKIYSIYSKSPLKKLN
jgi:hypothetical protein